MAVRDQCEQQPVDEFLLTGDDAAHLGFNPLKRLGADLRFGLEFFDIFLFH